MFAQHRCGHGTQTARIGSFPNFDGAQLMFRVKKYILSRRRQTQTSRAQRAWPWPGDNVSARRRDVLTIESADDHKRGCYDCR